MKRSKHGLFVFPPKKTLVWRRYFSIGQSCCSMTSKRRIHWFLESSRAWSFLRGRSLNQPKATRVCIRSINQSNRSISVRLLFLFCSRVFISRSLENRSISRKVVGKSARDNPEGYCGRFWVHYSSKKLERMTREPMGVCLRGLKESNKIRFDGYSVRNNRNSVLIISHITFWDCRLHIFSDNLYRNIKLRNAVILSLQYSSLQL